jgi:hypothetical protein
MEISLKIFFSRFGMHLQAQDRLLWHSKTVKVDGIGIEGFFLDYLTVIVRFPSVVIYPASYLSYCK